ncbi:hypothetical protein [Streptomyces sp. LS1784]|uniref:hypothetical protein n=1 Tax=Streptomyces sp. LS1784 TaxID=2851533 RepID=UPI001CCCCD98|nr:hypothetical protein [Streptomyces sp. LS1784]
MTFTFRQWLDQQHTPARLDGPTVGTIHGPSFLRRLSKLVTEPWDSPSTLLAHLGPDEEWPTELTADTREHYNAAFRESVGPRIGPEHSPAFERTLWSRRIGNDQYLFSARPDCLEVFRIPEDTPPQRIHTFQKETI